MDATDKFIYNTLKRTSKELLIWASPVAALDIFRNTVPILSFVTGIIDLVSLVTEDAVLNKNKTRRVKTPYGPKTFTNSNDYFWYKIESKYMPISSHIDKGYKQITNTEKIIKGR
jgi:hypothetical protein